MRVKKVWDFTIKSPLLPREILACVTDFSNKRPDHWPAISRNQYRVHKLGPTSAYVREGTGPMWTDERYDWSTPGLIRTIIQESNLFFPGGIWECRITPNKGGGSRIDVHMERDYRGLIGAMGSMYIVARGGVNLFRKDFLSMLESYTNNP